MIVDQALYEKGVRHPCTDLSRELARIRDETDEGAFIWIGLKDPTDEEFGLVDTELGLHPLAVEDAVKGNQRAKIERYDQTVFVVLKTLRYLESTSDIETGELMLFLGDRFVVTVRRGEASPLTRVRQGLEADPDRMAAGASAVLHAVVDAVVDTYTDIDVEVQRDLDQIEEAVFAGTARVDTSAIYRLKREVLEFKRAAVPLERPLAAMHGERSPVTDVETRLLFRDVSDHLLRVIDHIESYDRLLTDVLSAHLAQISVQQNDDMRRISAWVAIVAVPTMLAGIWGMNFDHMPELHWAYGYVFALGLMGLLGYVLYRMLRRAGWL